MAKPTVLFLTNSELGQATVCLAVAHEFLIRSKYAVHVASFSPLEPAIAQLNTRADALSQTGASTATFHTITGRSIAEANLDSRPKSKWFGTHDIGFYGALRAYSGLVENMIPWGAAEYMTAYRSCVEVIQKLQPAIVAVDPFFAQALDACRTLQCKYVILSPNTAKEHVVQPMLGNLWRYPILCSGYSYPLPWRHILPNTYLALTLALKMSQSPAVKAINEQRHGKGIRGPYPILSFKAGDTVPMLIASRPEIDFPSFIPDNITMCGPIQRPYLRLSDESSDLAKWLYQRPTVLINLGSHICFDSTQARKLADGLRMLFDARPDVQVLWKLKPDYRDGVNDWVAAALTDIIDELLEKRVRIEEWLPVEPSAILQSGNVCCMVHHGGANSYNEAIRAGVPQVILPVWYDTYDFARRVEYLGVGLWGSKTSAPAINGPELGKALTRVLHSEESSSMQEKAKSIASKLGTKEGRVVAMASAKVAWIGLGNIGRGMSRNIALKGPQTSPLILFNRTASKAAAFAKTITAEKPQAAIVAPSPSAAVKDADITFICVGDDPALDQIINTITSDSSVSLKDKIIVDCSTVHPDTSRRTHATLASHGASFIACPVFGAPNAADAGQMVVIPAGSPASIDKIRPFLDGVTSKATLDLGPESEKDVGRATLLKVLGNTFILNTVETLAEGLVAAEKSGLGTKAYAEWVSTMFPGPFAKYAERMSSGEYFKREEPLFAVDLARKDLRHAANLAESSGMTLKSVKVTDDYLKVVKEEKGEKGDIAAVYGAIRKEAGLPFDNE
ncbi:hypothetical protein BJX66DRAFT_326924 [Aspergillus keveii]|uniref:UDP-glucoronosyl and UDP-glucosyl transferase family protein n=1 Tax=Aspergillus keveii TaxID=714993 RepID=A0ABR4G0I2_9EURO